MQRREHGMSRGTRLFFLGLFALVVTGGFLTNALYFSINGPKFTNNNSLNNNNNNKNTAEGQEETSKCVVYNEKVASIAKYCISNSKTDSCSSRVSQCVDSRWKTLIIPNDEKSSCFYECLKSSSVAKACGFDECKTSCCESDEESTEDGISVQPSNDVTTGKDGLDDLGDTQPLNCTQDSDCGCKSGKCCIDGSCNKCEFVCDDFCPWYTKKQCISGNCRDSSCLTRRDEDEVPVSAPIQYIPQNEPVGEIDSPHASYSPEEPTANENTPTQADIIVPPVTGIDPSEEPTTTPELEPISVDDTISPAFMVVEDPSCSSDSDCGCGGNCCVDGKCSSCSLCDDECMYCVGDYCHDLSC